MGVSLWPITARMWWHLSSWWGTSRRSTTSRRFCCCSCLSPIFQSQWRFYYCRHHHHFRMYQPVDLDGTPFDSHPQITCQATRLPCLPTCQPNHDAPSHHTLLAIMLNKKINLRRRSPRIVVWPQGEISATLESRFSKTACTVRQVIKPCYWQL